MQARRFLRPADIKRADVRGFRIRASSFARMKASGRQARTPSSMGIVVAAVAAIDVKAGAARNHEFLRGYEKLKLGMSRSEVETLLLAPAAYECSYGQFRVSYYVRQSGTVLGLIEGPRPRGLPSEVARISELPEIYAAVQVAFAADNRLAAFTWNGETLTVVAADGSRVRGSNLRVLGPELLRAKGASIP